MQSFFLEKPSKNTSPLVQLVLSFLRVILKSFGLKFVEETVQTQQRVRQIVDLMYFLINFEQVPPLEIFSSIRLKSQPIILLNFFNPRPNSQKVWAQFFYPFKVRLFYQKKHLQIMLQTFYGGSLFLYILVFDVFRGHGKRFS